MKDRVHCDTRNYAMWLPKVVICVLIVKSCLVRGISEIPEQDDFSLLVQAMVKVTTSCYENQLNAVGLAGNSDAFHIKALQSSTSVPVSLLDGTKRFVSHDPVERQNRYKLQVFIVTTSSATELKNILTVMKNSFWWNHEASVLIVAWLPMSENGCSKAFEMLSAAWKMNLLNTKLMCLHHTKEILIYTYNPYVGIAPDCWNVENIYSEENRHPWTLFKRRYEEDKGICEELDFDKTKDLGGYEIRATVKNHSGYITVAVQQSGRHRFGGYLGTICNIMFRPMNATLKILVYNQTKVFSYSGQNGRNIMLDVVDGFSDIILNRRYLTIEKDMSATYPDLCYGMSILTQHSRQMSQLSKISSVVDNYSRWGVFLVILITLLFLIFFLRQGIGQALLNTLRMICNGALLTLPLNLAPRFYLGGLFIFVVTIQAIYQGKLAALLTKPIFLPNVNTIQDLIDGKYTIYTYKSTGHYFNSRDFEGHHVELENTSCTKYLLHDPLAACLTQYNWMIESAVELKMYLSKEILFLPLAFFIRDDWPLEPRVNKILNKMFESYIIQYESAKPIRTLLDVRKFNEEREKEQKFQVMTLDELSFAFVILGIGLSCATSCFIVERRIPILKILMAVSQWRR